jgi:hypothetical protein
MTPGRGEVLRELERISRLGFLSPQERGFLRHVVLATLEQQRERLYQKALAEDLKIEHPLQIGVIGSRIRAKLAEHYADSQVSPVRIDLSRRGYEAVFSYRPHIATRGDRVDILIANAKTAIDQRTLPG